MTLVHIGGVPVRLHGSFVLLVGGWLVFTVAWSGPLAALHASVFVVVFFGSVLAHELGHVGVARWFGIPTRSILLTPVGGLAEIQARAVRPHVDLAISLAGPLASLALAAVGIALAVVTKWEVAVVLGAVNLLLGLFNLIPAFPMDGGRVLRAALVPSLGASAAHRIALAVGAGFSVIFALVGFLWPEPGLVILAVFMGVLQWREHKLRLLLQRHAAPAAR